MAGSTVSTVITTEVTLGQGIYLSPLSVASAGTIENTSGYGIQIYDIANGSVTNSGSIIGDNAGIYLGQSSATIVNLALIDGANAAIAIQNFNAGEALVSNSGTLTGGKGITGQEAEIANSGFIYGSNAGIHLDLSTIANTGTIVGGETGAYSLDGSLTNHGAIRGNALGITILGGEALNFGSISGGLGAGARVNDLFGGGGAVVAGAMINDGSISGGGYGVYAGSGSFSNNGKVSGRIGLGVGNGGAATNSGGVYGSAYGAELFGKPSLLGGANLTNTGSITGGDIGVTLGLRGNLINSGYVYAPNFGAIIYNGYLTNSGRVVNADVGVTLSGSGGVVNNTGTISGLTDGVAESGGLVANYGTISGATNGALVTGGSLANFRDISGVTYGVSDAGANVANYGLISSPDYGVAVLHGVVTNGGTISGGLDAIEGSFVTLAVQPGAVFIGQVENDSGRSLLELNGPGIGALSGIGSQITGFKEISFAAGPQWSIEGDQAGLTGGQTITGFARGDTIVLDGFSATSDIYVKDTGLELANSISSVTLDILGNFTTSSFQVTETAGTTSIIDVTCFARGTRIATPNGEVAVEALIIGDLVNTRFGGAKPVKWIGRRSYHGRFIRGNAAVLPIRIKAGAIADGVPARDLRVSPGHAISIDDVLVHAKRLVNGVSVLQEDGVEEISYFHIELQDHEIVFAESCPAESFMDERFRRQFQNAEEFARLHPGQTAPRLICQPRLESGFLLHAIQRRVRGRAGLTENPQTGALRGYVDQAGPKLCFGWAQDIAAPEVPVSLDILRGGRRVGRVLANLYRQDVADAGHGDGYQGFEFELPAGRTKEIEVRRSSDGAKLRMSAERAA